MYLKQITDEALSQYAYLIACQRTGEAILIDPERDIDRYIEIARRNDFRIVAVAETHIHADFLSGTLEFLASDPDVIAYLSDMGPPEWKYSWTDRFQAGQTVPLMDGDTISIGKIEIKAIHTPGHTPEHLSFLVYDYSGGANQPMALISGDFVFVGDVGRPDLLESAAGQMGAREPAARELFQSISRFTDLPDFVQVLPGHGSGSACGKALGAVPSSTVGYERRFNSAIVNATVHGEETFVDAILEGQPEPPPYFARMKQLNKNGASIIGGLPGVKWLSGKDINKLIAQNEAVILDHSRPNRAAFMSRHLKGSLYAPEAHFSTVAGSYVAPDQPIILLLDHQMESEELVRQLVRIGYDNIVGYSIFSDLESDSSLSDDWVSTPTITTSDLYSEHLPSRLVIDVRSEVEFLESHVPGAIRIGHTQIAKQLKEIPDQDLLVHCGSGMRASLAVPFLEREGFRVTYVDGLFSQYHPKPLASVR